MIWLIILALALAALVITYRVAGEIERWLWDSPKVER